MAQDTYTEVTTQSWLSRIKGSFAGALFGLLLFIASFFVLWLNEGNSLKTAEALREARQVLTVLSRPVVSPENEGKLIHVSGTARTSERLSDAALGVSATAMRLLRDVEMYQWVETSKSRTRERAGGSKETVTTYTYNKKWSGTPQDSTKFKKPNGHANPEMMFTSTSIAAEDASLGQFHLPARLVGRLDASKDLRLSDADVDKVSTATQRKAVLYDGHIYIGTGGSPKPRSPKVGDYRVRYRTTPAATPVSVISTQTGDNLEPFMAKNGKTVELIETGITDADGMVDKAQKSNALTTWLLRLLGFFVMFFGLVLILNPLSAIGAVIPAAGRIVSAGTGMAAFLLSLCLSLVTISIAWVAYRPLYAGILLICAASAALAFNVKRQSRHVG